MEHLETRKVKLRPICERDHLLLHKWRNEERHRRLASNRRNPLSFADFQTELKGDLSRNRQLQFMIEAKSVAEPIGTIFSYDLNLTDGYVFITIYIAEDYERKGYGVEATLLLVFFLFDGFPINKIYFEVFGYNELSFSAMKKGDLVEEGRFREHRFYRGERHDLVRLALFRNESKRLRDLLDRLKNAKPPRK